MSTTTKTASFDRLGARFAGTCCVCGSHTGTAAYQLAATALYRDRDGGYHVAHANCVGSTKNAVSGGLKWRSGPRAAVEIE